MNLRATIYAVKKYGLKGIIEYFSRQPKEMIFRHFLNKTIRSIPPQSGITLITCFDYPGSLSKVMRDLAMMLKLSGVPYQTLNISSKNPIPSSETAAFLTNKKDFCLNRYTHVITMRDPIKISDKRCKVYCVEFWEFEDGFIESCPESLRAQNVLAMSNFNRDVFRRWLPDSIDVKKVLYPFQFIHSDLMPRESVRRKYGINIDDFVVFFNFDYASSYFRKNPEGILYASAKALRDKPNAKIVFKTMRAKKCKPMSDRLHSLAEELGLTAKLITIDDFIPQEDLVNLTNACDVYMSLHRGEGFGLGIAEAMSLGKAVIVTDYSSTTEFCNRDNSIPIPYKIIPIKRSQIDNDAYRHVTSWADPDIDAAADALTRLYNDKNYRDSIGAQAQSYISEHFSLKEFKKSIDELLQII